MKAASSPGGFALNLLIWLAALLWSLPMLVALWIAIHPAAGQGHFSLLAPLTLARLIQAAAPGKHDNVLDIGGATGYSTGVLSRLAGTVISIEQDHPMVDRARNALQGVGVENVEGFVGPLAEATLARLTFDRAFLGADSVHAELGICEAELEQTRLKELMIERAGTVYILAHAAKLEIGRAHV